MGRKKIKDMMGDILVCSFIGVFLAQIYKYLCDNGILIDDFITGTSTITDVMTVVIIIWVMIGVIVGVSRN